MSESSSSTPEGNSRNRTLIIVVVLAFLCGLLIVCVAGYFLLRNQGVIGSDDITPTPFASAIDPNSADSSAIVVSSLEGSPSISLTVNIPVSLDISGNSFVIQTDEAGADGVWSPTLDENSQVASWVYGTVINYAVGMFDNDDNRAVLEGLEPGDEMALTMRDGTVYTFIVTSREVLTETSIDVFSQQTPGVTVFLVGSSGSDRLVVQGDYFVTSGGTSSSGSGGIVEVGETAQLGDIQLTVSDSASLFDRPEAPTGFSFFLINYQIRNVGVEAIDTSPMQLALFDDFGNQYVLNPIASSLGANLPLQGTLAAGEVRDATAGYQIPAGLTSPSLIWKVQSADGNEVSVNVPFSVGISESSTNVIVSPQGASVSVDGSGLTINGQITNAGDQPIIVDETQASLTSSGTVYLILSTNPGFPWIIPPGQTANFSLSFQRPIGSDAVFTLLNQPFQLTGLR